jgi:CRISPR system Cascade subunit CasE
MTILTRATLRRDASVAALKPLLIQGNGATHHLAWSLYADTPDRRRDFLFRDSGDGTLYALSDREPVDCPLFEIASRAVSVPHGGDRLSFTLRANPVVRIKRSDGKTTKCDAIMHALRNVPRGDARREARMRIAHEVTEAWLRRLGETGGYTLDAMALDAYRQERIARRGAAPVQFGVVDVAGVLTVTDGTAFVARQHDGFGASRAWGCGLMLTRPFISVAD